MKNYINQYTVANEVRMKRSQYTGAFLIVEGDTDARFYKNFINNDKCRIIVSHSKQNAVGALDILEKGNFDGLLVLVDADFWTLNNEIPSIQNLLLTDTHDMETLLLKSPALEKVLNEFALEDKLGLFTKQLRKDIRKILLESGAPIGYLRWFSLRENLSLKFKDLAFVEFINQSTLETNISKLIKTVKSNSKMWELNEREIQKKMEELRDDTHDLWYVCCGHDLIYILVIGLRKIFGIQKSKDIKTEILEKSLRLAYERSYFYTTQLYKSIRQWEKTNTHFQILAIE